MITISFKLIANSREPLTNSSELIASAAELKIWLGKKKIYFSESMSLDDLFTLVNLELVESQLNQAKVIFLSDYPPYAAALAKIDKSGVMP